MNMTESLKISSMNLTAYLCSQGFGIINTHREGRKVFFHFSDTSDLRGAIDEFRYGDALVPAKRLLSAQEEIKSLIYDQPF